MLMCACVKLSANQKVELHMLESEELQKKRDKFINKLNSTDTNGE